MVGFLVYPPKLVVLNFGRWSKGLTTGKHVESKVACSCHWQPFELGFLVAWNLLRLIGRKLVVLGRMHLGVGMSGVGWAFVAKSTFIRNTTCGVVRSFSVGTSFWPQDAMKLIFKTFLWIVESCFGLRLEAYSTCHQSMKLRLVRLSLPQCPPARFHDRGMDGNSACLWCSSLGTWDHLCWCPASPLEPRVCPCNALLRFGWLRERDPTETLHYMARVQQTIWEHRYRSG